MKSLMTMSALSRVPLGFNFATTKITVRESINTAMADEMERDSNVFLMGIKTNNYSRWGSGSLLGSI